MHSVKSRITCFFVVLLSILVLSLPATAQETESDEPVVQAVLFFSPTCPHCHEVITNFLAPMMEDYGTQLDVLGVDVTTEAGSYLYNQALAHFEIPDDRRGVPTLVYKDTVLVGGFEIPEIFPGLVEAGLAEGGVGWPDIPELAEVVEDLPPSADPNAAPETPATESDALAEATTAVSTQTPLPTTSEPTAIAAVEPDNDAVQSLANIDTTNMATTESAPPPDPIGFALGWLVLLGLFVILISSVWQLGTHWTAIIHADTPLSQTKGRTVAFWLFIGAGLIVAGYLAYVETMQVTAVCGPVGECNIVQASPYARILGIPVAVLGLLAYLTMALLWFLQRVDNLRRMAALALVGLTFFATFFSIYLTLLELFVIGAICMWCLSSAVVSGLLCLLVVTGLVKRPLPPSPQWQTD